ncbi:Qat anti-phage system QueC-like protein QatC [Aeromicrobium sp. CFBP 8757]|uniref:Qat anti-phage system QueC-like protein QatC n=1 Tax=Aeromicrobium sp. CFBP 8757 TaxID=2775288 RepID=UPI0035303650
MRYVAGPSGFTPPAGTHGAQILLFGNQGAPRTVGHAIETHIRRACLDVHPQARDFLAIALAAITADQGTLRSDSSDGWTREIHLHVGVEDADIWSAASGLLSAALQFLTTDRWTFSFSQAEYANLPGGKSVAADSVALLSGGLDSLIGVHRLMEMGADPILVSHTVRGDKEKQSSFAAALAPDQTHIQLGHNAVTPGSTELSQRSRSLEFIALGVLFASARSPQIDGTKTPFWLCENGFIAVNPPLTPSRLGSLSTRTAHPTYLSLLNRLLAQIGLSIEIQNPHRFETKGEMLLSVASEPSMEAMAIQSTSCGRFLRNGYKHCGRCIPCQVRRGAFLRAGIADTTGYIYENLGIRDGHHAQWKDVRAVGLAVATASGSSVQRWGHPALAGLPVTEQPNLLGVVSRGLAELSQLHSSYGVS